MAETIELQFGMVSEVGPRNRVKRAHWRHLANTVERLYAVAVSATQNISHLYIVLYRIGILLFILYVVTIFVILAFGPRRSQI